MSISRLHTVITFRGNLTKIPQFTRMGLRESASRGCKNHVKGSRVRTKRTSLLGYWRHADWKTRSKDEKAFQIRSFILKSCTRRLTRSFVALSFTMEWPYRATIPYAIRLSVPKINMKPLRRFTKGEARDVDRRCGKHDSQSRISVWSENHRAFW